MDLTCSRCDPPCIGKLVLPLWHLTLPDLTTSPQVYPHGSTDALPFATMGSGSLNAMAMFEVRLGLKALIRHFVE